MKVFLSWSKQKSHEVAMALKEWLPLVIQSVDPYVSSEDIDKGARWSSDVAKVLEECSYGIICVTPENMEEPWLMFEAGALSKKMDESFVCPFLLGVKRVDIKGPLAQFQSVIFEKSDVLKLMNSINNSCQDGAIKPDVLERTFEKWWPQLETKLKEIEKAPVEKQDSSTATQKDEILEELLELSRRIHRTLSNPASILPSEYLDRVVRFAVNNEKTPATVAQNIQMINSVLYRLKSDWDMIYPTISTCLTEADKTNANQLFPIASRIYSEIQQVHQMVLIVIGIINQEVR